MTRAAAAILLLSLIGCRGAPEAPAPSARNFLLITIDTLRADRVGAYGDRTARTPSSDAIAARGARFTSAFTVAPITLPAHASVMTGRYPPGHQSRHNGIRIDAAVPTIAETLAARGFATAAFVGAFPLDRRFGLDRGFQVYGDTMPRGGDGRPANERPGGLVVDEAMAWLGQHGGGRFFVWVHLFEPHAPYGDARDGRPAAARYGDDVAEADRQVGRLIAALGARSGDTLVTVAADHGEAFGEHGEIAHSIFVYDTTIRVPLIFAGPGVPARTVDHPVSLVDVAPTALRLLGIDTFDADGVDLHGLLQGQPAGGRTLYAESFAPLLDFGWSPLRSVRVDGWKYIAAPKPELYHVREDAAESRNAIAGEPDRAATLRARVDRFSSDAVQQTLPGDKEARARLQALGYASGSRTTGARPDPKDRRELAARIAQVTAGDVHGAALERLLRQILEEDGANPLANLRLGYVLLDSGRCAEAAARFRAAIRANYPSADAHMGLAACQAEQRDFNAAAETLRAGDRLEPGNPVVLANLGLMLSDGGDPAAAIAPLQRALAIDPEMHQARFGLAIALARSGRQPEARRHAEELLRRMPPGAPQRGEVERLLAALK